MEIRSARPEDAGALRALRLRAMADAPDAFGSSLAREEARPESWWGDLASGRRGLVLLATVGATPVGMAGALADGRVWGMWVAPEARRRGAGRALLFGIERWAREHGLSELALSVSEAMPAARALYESAGFVPDGTDEPLESNPALRTWSLRRRL